MKKTVTFLFLLLINFSFSQTKTDKIKLYDPNADAKAEIKAAVEKAGKEGKHVLLQVGGNWCSWCIKFHNKVTVNDTLRRMLDSNYVTCHVNYSKENENPEVMAMLGYPQRFGFPVFVILDGKGNRIHTQNSAYLEQGKEHGTQLIIEFLQQWSPSALDPKNYGKRK